MDRFRLGGPRREFSLSTLVSSLIAHLGIILYLHLSFLLFKLYIYCLLYLLMA